MKTSSTFRIDINAIKNRKETMILFPMVIFIIILFITLFSFNNLSSIKRKNELLSQEVLSLKNRRDNILLNLKMLNENSDFINYNQILGMLVPESEDFFSIIYTLQQISQQSGLIIENYVVSIGRSTNQKTSISITYVNDQTSFMKFLDLYQYSGGRLVTIPKINWKSDSSGKTKVLLNFYSKGYVPTNGQVFKISKAEQNKVKDILSKIKINVLNPEATPEVSVDYETKDNPFEP